MQSIKFNSRQEAEEICRRVFESAAAEGLFDRNTLAYAISEKEELWTVPVLASAAVSFFTHGFKLCLPTIAKPF